MAVILNTTLGDLVIDLHTELCPFTTKNFLKLCKLKYYNNCLFHNVKKDLLAQTGDPTGKGSGGDSVYKFLYGDQARFFNDELRPNLTHGKIGTVAMASAGQNLNASQFYITLGAGLDYLDGKHTVFGEVAGGLETLMRINEAYVDDNGRPYKNIRIKQVDILEDPFEDPPALEELIPVRSPEMMPRAEGDDARLEDDWVRLDEQMDAQELDKSIRQKEAHSHGGLLEMGRRWCLPQIGDLPEAEVAPSENGFLVTEHQRGGDLTRRDANDGDIMMGLRSGDFEEPSNTGELHESTIPEREDWSPAEAITLLEAYEERLGDGRTGNLKAKEWEGVTAAVNRRFDGKGIARKSLKQCKRKVYALRRWFKVVMSKRMTFREGGYDHTLLCVLERIMTPSTPCQAGIPGGIDAGERQSMPQTPSLFDEEEPEEELIQASRAVMPPELGEAFADMVSSMQSRRGVLPDDRKRRAVPTNTPASADSNCSNENVSSKKPCWRSCGSFTHSDEIVSALNSFAKVLAQIEQTKIDIMKDLDKRRAELQLKLEAVEPLQQDQSDESPPSALLTLL